MEILSRWDQAVFHSINHVQHPVLDALFLWIAEFRTETWFALILLFTLLSQRKDRWRITFLGIILLIGLDFANDFLLKPFFHRPRPYQGLEGVILKSYSPSSFSFPSGHAVHIFALAVFFGFYYPNFVGVLGLTTILISLSRVYIGVHYPLDVLGGAFIGTLSALMWRWLERKTRAKSSF